MALTQVDAATTLMVLKAALAAAFLCLQWPCSTHVELNRGFTAFAPFARLKLEELTVLGSSKLQTLVWTSHLGEAEQFYGGVLGLPLKGKSEGATVYDVGGADLRVSPVPSTQPSAHTVVGFAVANLTIVMEALSQRGITWEHFPELPQDENGVLVTPEGAKVAWFRDPDGNLLSIVQYT